MNGQNYPQAPIMNGQYYPQAPIMNEQYYTQAPIMNEQYYSQAPIMNRRPIAKNNNNLLLLLFLAIVLATLYYTLIFLPEKKAEEKAEADAAAAAAAAEKKKKEEDEAALPASSKSTSGTLSPADTIKLNTIKTRLATYPVQMHGGTGGIQYDFDCDSTIDDYINFIGGQHNGNVINGIELKCKSGKKSNYYGYKTATGVVFGTNSSTPFSLFSGRSASLLDSIHDPLPTRQGGNNGNPWTHNCTGNEITRGVRIRAGSLIDSIGFKCA